MRINVSGDDIYRSVLDNRFSAFVQERVMQSGDRGGNALRTEVALRYKNDRKTNERELTSSH